jgi:hypothetical protein
MKFFLAPQLRVSLLRFAGVLGVAGAVLASARPAVSASTPTGVMPAAVSTTRFAAADWTPDAMSGINPEVFGLALAAANCAVQSGDVPVPSTLSVIDYSLPSTTQRLWVFDLPSHALLYRELVAHGQGSGGDVPTHFSNEADTHSSSLGLFVTGETYTGKNGYSLRLAGLDRGFNDHALARAIVMHGAPYVNTETAQALGRLGRSWGCPALREGIAHEVIDRVKGGNLVFAYYPDPEWLARSKYLGDCGRGDRLAEASTSAPISKFSD